MIEDERMYEGNILCWSLFIWIMPQKRDRALIEI